MDTTFFTEEERKSTLKELVVLAKNKTDILGTVLVGSGARGSTDQYSDIDIIYVTEKSGQEIYSFDFYNSAYTVTLRILH